MTTATHALSTTARICRSRKGLSQPGELIALAFILFFEFAVYASDARAIFSAANIIGPLAMAFVLAWSSLQMALRSSETMWAPLFWFRLATLTYYGVGNVIPFTLNNFSDRYIRSVYNFDNAELLKFNLVCLLGVLVCLGVAQLWFRLAPGQPENSEQPAIVGAGSTFPFAIAFLIVGGFVRYFIDLPVQFGLIEGTVPGVAIQVEKAFYAGVFLLSLDAFKPGGRHRILLGAMVTCEVLLSIASFAKLALVMILVFPFLGMLANRVSILRIALAAACILAAYAVFQPVVSYGRNAMIATYGATGVSVEDRLHIARDYFRYGYSGDTTQYGLSRFSYVNVGTYAISRFDSGQPGRTFSDAATVLIPRFIWPDKPNITRAGGELFTQIYRRKGSQLGVGFFPEAYWNFGWLGLIGVMAVLGTGLAWYSLLSVTVMARRDWLYLPIVLIGVQIGYRVDGFIVPDVVGPAGIALAFGMAVAFVSRLLGASRGNRPHRLALATR